MRLEELGKLKKTKTMTSSGIESASTSYSYSVACIGGQ
jgi:hypothetical protein